MKEKTILIISTIFSIFTVLVLGFFIYSKDSLQISASLFSESLVSTQMQNAQQQELEPMTMVSQLDVDFLELPQEIQIPEIEAPILVEPTLPKKATLVAVGDIMLSRYVADKMKQKDDTNYPFAEVSQWLMEADIVFGNLENPITKGDWIAPYEMRLRADPGIEKTLRDHGFDVLSLANNHLPDFGDEGIQDTLDLLDEVGIANMGAGMNLDEAREAVFLNRNGLTFAFLAYNDTDVVPDSYEAGDEKPGTAIMNLEWVTEDVKEAKAKADFVIVSMHSGHEYIQTPNVSQTEFAHAAIDAGAELVIGHHPHVVQTMEKYNGKYIFYSLGNFIFDQDHSTDVRRGLGFEVDFDERGVTSIRFKPVQIKDYAQPQWMEKLVADEVIKRLNYPVEEDPVIEYEFGEEVEEELETENN